MAHIALSLQLKDGEYGILLCENCKYDLEIRFYVDRLLLYENCKYDLEIRFSVAMMNTTAQDDRLLLNVRTTPMLSCAVLPCPTLCLPCSALP
ncbi:hypothetical protein E2C01_041022 [Portunus trituberculatus]|uniref:Uncharacterized protein n=1 Tax=Portunus trituberculatus TaxID=210409 RepID=A0A5B7FI39_PORTR|nr:hypothetical protein [Portunus trituberculatus]